MDDKEWMEMASAELCTALLLFNELHLRFVAENVEFVEVNNFCFMCISKCCQMHAVKKTPNPRKPAERIVSVGLILGNVFRFRT